MNFLAHCLLADPPRGCGYGEGWRDGLLAGAILGDFVKGRVPDTLPPALIAGIRLHRRIDSYSNRLPEMRASFARFSPTLRRPAPVLLDLVADHCLALGWRRHAGPGEVAGDLPVFAGRVHSALERTAAWRPGRAQRFVRHLVETNLLARYADPQAVYRAMAHVLKRLGLQDRTGALAGVLDGDLPGFQQDFDRYFPLLREFAAAERVSVWEAASSAPP